jgi:hypothetical protein
MQSSHKETFALLEIVNLILQIRYIFKQNKIFCREAQVKNAN